MKTDVRPIVIVGLAILIVWYGAAITLNGPLAAAEIHQAGEPSNAWTLATRALAVSRPILPTPDKIVAELLRSILDFPPTDPHSILYHVGVTAFSTLIGFVLGSIIGMLLAIGIVHAGALEASLMPWIVASQTVPILAIAPMAIIILGNLGLVGILPKALIAAYLSFFPVAIAAVKGLRSTDRFIAELMRTYSASRAQMFWKVRLPSCVPFLFAGLKVGVAVSVIGAIVAELPTGSTSGLGARLLSGSYYGQTLQIWSALAMSAALSLGLVNAVAAAERLVRRAMGSAR
jgi:NitT/TauT family transport system permease protein